MNIIVTGASRGIGYETVRLLAAEAGVKKVFAVARDAKKLSRLQGPKVIPFAFDLTSPGFSPLLREIKKHAVQVDILINNAGALVNKPFDRITREELGMMYKVNVFGPFLLTQALLPLMNTKKSRAHVLNISSMGGFQGSVKFKGLSAYSSSKGALAVLTECMAEELKEKNVAVNCLCLGAAQTEMLSQAFPGYKAPLTAKQMAGFVADFALKGHHYFNGKILPVSLSTP